MSTDIATTDRISNGALAAPPPQRREVRVVQDDGPLAFMLDTARFEHMNRVASAMSASVFLPLHLQGYVKGGQIADGDWFDKDTRIANCFRVLNQAMRWNVDPFAVCDETYVIGGKLAYQGKLIAAIVNTRAGLKGRLTYKFDGERDSRRVKVAGTFKEAPDEPCEIELTVGQAKTNNQMWTKDPDQKLVYSGVVKWARRFCPEIIMGVMTDDDADRVAELSVSPQTREMLPTESLSSVIAQQSRPTITQPEIIDPPAGSPSRNSAAAPDTHQDGAPGSEERPTDNVPDVATKEAFIAAMDAVAKEHGVDPERLDTLLGKLPALHNTNAPRINVAIAGRLKVLNAFKAGTLDLDTGQINE